MDFLFEFIVISGIGYLIKKLRDHEKDHALLKEINVDQTRNTLLDIHGKAMKYGDIQPNKRETFYKLFESYEKLGGNGFVEKLKKDIDEM